MPCFGLPDNKGKINLSQGTKREEGEKLETIASTGVSA